MTSDFRADLHCHSLCSDGSDSPSDLLRKAKEIGLKGLSITDHDTIEAYTPELFSLAQTLEIQLLSGIELSSELKNDTVHVLGYGFDVHSPSLLSFIQEMQRRRVTRNRAILEKLKQKKIIILEEELEQLAKDSGFKKSIGRPHIAALMVEKGYVGSFQDAFERYLKEGTCCYVPGFKFTPQDAVSAIQRGNGKAVIAHPHFIKKGKLLKELLSIPFQGIECYYGTLRKQQEAPWVKIAKEKNWIATGGSDYHGSFKPHISLGCSWVNENTLQQLLSR